ncbi:transcriptional regulator, partial [Staphylococcus epidermidis]|uniref:transcriptional regulator n=1 Tax=Staphylococcus epidermidis TaxID=1282 RepID=UPI001C92F7AD
SFYENNHDYEAEVYAVCHDYQSDYKPHYSLPFSTQHISPDKFFQVHFPHTTQYNSSAKHQIINLCKPICPHEEQNNIQRSYYIH